MKRTPLEECGFETAAKEDIQGMNEDIIINKERERDRWWREGEGESKGEMEEVGGGAYDIEHRQQMEGRKWRNFERAGYKKL